MVFKAKFKHTILNIKNLVHCKGGLCQFVQTEKICHMIHHCFLTYSGSWSVYAICSSDPLTGSLNLLKVSVSALQARGKRKHSLPYRMQSFEDPWTEEDNEAPEHPYYNNIPNKIPPPGGFLDARLKTRLPTAADTPQVSIISFLLSCYFIQNF